MVMQTSVSNKDLVMEINTNSALESSDREVRFCFQRYLTACESILMCGKGGRDTG